MPRNSRSKKQSIKTVLLYYYGKIIGLCPLALHHDGNWKFSFRGVLYALVLSVTYFFIFIFSVGYRFKSPFPSEPIVSLLVDGFIFILQFNTVTACWLIFAFRQKKLQSIIETIKNTDQMAQKLGIKGDHEEIIRLIGYRVLIVNIYFGGLCISDQLLFSKFPQYKMIIYAPFNAVHIVMHNVLFLFITALSVIHRRFHRLNLRLKNVMVIDRGIGVHNDFRELRFSTAVNIEHCGELHEELKLLAESIANFFAFPILNIMIVCFVKTVHTINAMLLMIKYRSDWDLMGIWVTWTSLFKMLGNILDFFFLSIISETICEQANNTGNILHKIWIYYKPINCQQTIKKVSMQLLQRRLSISLYGFIDLDFQFIYRICGTVTTYLIIMLQLDDYKSKENSHQ